MPFKAIGKAPKTAKSIAVTIVATSEAGDTAQVEVDNLFAEGSNVLFGDSFED